MEGPSLDAVAAMARDLGVRERPDDEVLSYLAGVFADAHDAEEYFGIAASFLPELEDVSAVACTQAFQRLSGAVSSPGPGSGPARTSRALGVSTLVEEFPHEGEASLRKLLFEECGGDVDRARDLLLRRARAKLEEETEADRQEERMMQAVSAEAVELLKGVAPHVPESALRRVLVLDCSGDMEAAATRVLEEDVVALDRERREQAQRRRRDAAKQAEAEVERVREARYRVLERFEDEAVAPREAGRPGGAPPPFGMKEVKGGAAKKKKKGTGGAQVRYLDGRVVSTKGERYVATQQKEEDPSTFVPLKIKTKGKRGPGFR